MTAVLKSPSGNIIIQSALPGYALELIQDYRKAALEDGVCILALWTLLALLEGNDSGRGVIMDEMGEDIMALHLSGVPRGLSSTPHCGIGERL